MAWYNENKLEYTEESSNITKGNFKRYKFEEEIGIVVIDNDRNKESHVMEKRTLCKRITDLIKINKVERLKMYEWINNEEMRIQKLMEERNKIEMEINNYEKGKWQKIYEEVKQGNQKERKSMIEQEMRKQIEFLKKMKNDRIAERHEMYEGRILECWNNIGKNMGKEKQKLTEEIEEIQKEENEVYKEIARLYGFETYEEFSYVYYNPRIGLK